MLNREHAHAADAAAMVRGIRAALSPKPDIFLLDALSDTGGVDTRTIASDQSLAAANDEVADKWVRLLGGQ